MRNFLAGYISPRTDVRQMRENLSLLSFWGLVFSLIAVTLFVVIYSYQKTKGANRNIVEDLRQRSVDIYLAAKTGEAETDSQKFRGAADEIERLRAETSVLFWLIIAMNTAVITIFTLAYRIL
jgi:hypothetical protein